MIKNIVVCDVCQHPLENGSQFSICDLEYNSKLLVNAGVDGKRWDLVFHPDKSLFCSIECFVAFLMKNLTDGEAGKFPGFTKDTPDTIIHTDKWRSPFFAAEHLHEFVEDLSKQGIEPDAMNITHDGEFWTITVKYHKP